MVLIIGGAYQGKLDYALGRFGLTDGDVYRCEIDNVETPAGKCAVYGLDKWILALLKAGMDTAEAVRRFADANGAAVVICDDISCGVVPIDPLERKWREATGRALVELTKSADEVVRMFCGIPTKLK